MMSFTKTIMMSIEIPFAKVMGGTLLIVTSDNRTYEVKRHNSDIVVMPDADTPDCTAEEKAQFIALYCESDAARR